MRKWFKSNKKLVNVLIFFLILIGLSFTLLLIKQRQSSQSSAAAADKLETEGGTLGGNATVQSDTTASGGSFVALGINQATPTPTSANSPTKTPTPAPSSGTVYNVPTSIDSTGATNVTTALQTFINGVPNNSTIVFKAGGRYKIGTALRISNKSNITLNGNGARLDPVMTMALRISDSSSITLRGFTIVGDDPEVGTPAACCTNEGFHAVAIYSSVNTVAENMNISRIWGDCFYANASTVPGGTWSDRATFRDSTCTLVGRHGVGIIRARNVLVERVRFDEIGFDVVDIEPGAADAGADGFTFRNNNVGTYGHGDQDNSWLLAACGKPGATVKNVTVSGNTVEGQQIGWTGSSGTKPKKAISVRVCGDVGPRSNFTVTNNTTAFVATGPAMTFVQVNGVTVTGNRQPLSSGSLVSSSGSTNVVVSSNVTN